MNMLTVNVERNGYYPGEILKGNVSWFVDKDPKKIEVRLFWYTKGKGTEDAYIVDSKTIEPLINQGQHDFQFELPAGPYSFSGKLISLIWAVEFVINPVKDFARQDITISPTKKEVLIT
jgi:hypothetical protein